MSEGYRFNGKNADGREMTGRSTTETPAEIAQRFFNLGFRDLVVIPLAGGPVCAGVEKNSKGVREWWADPTPPLRGRLHTDTGGLP